jgi:hypothetical protein
VILWNLFVVDTHNPMEFVVTKWQNISKAVVELNDVSP